MEILNISIAAGETKRFEKAAGYFELLSCDYPVSLFFSGPAGNRVDDAQGVISGIFGNVRFKAFEVYSVTAQTIQLLLNDGNGGSRRQPGNVAIIDRVSPVCQTMVVTNLATVFAANVIVAPGANLNGILIRSSLVGVSAGTGLYQNGKLVAALVAPVSINPATQSIFLNGASSLVSGQLVSSALFDTRRLIPAGWGLYYLTEGTAPGGTVSNVNVSYEIL